MSSDEDVNQLLAAFKKSSTTTPGANARTSATSSRHSIPRHSPVQRSPAKKSTPALPKNSSLDSYSAEDVASEKSPPKVRRLLYIRPKPLKNKDEYVYYEPQDEVDSVIHESTRRGAVTYEVKLVGGETRKVSETAPPVQQVRKGKESTIKIRLLRRS